MWENLEVGRPANVKAHIEKPYPILAGLLKKLMSILSAFVSTEHIHIIPFFHGISQLSRMATDVTSLCFLKLPLNITVCSLVILVSQVHTADKTTLFALDTRIKLVISRSTFCFCFISLYF